MNYLLTTPAKPWKWLVPITFNDHAKRAIIGHYMQKAESASSPIAADITAATYKTYGGA
jgi:hypothetical protein